jgi:hypothetical protein
MKNNLKNLEKQLAGLAGRSSPAHPKGVIWTDPVDQAERDGLAAIIKRCGRLFRQNQTIMSLNGLPSYRPSRPDRLCGARPIIDPAGSCDARKSASLLPMMRASS